jgi:hypothetical protein
LRIVRNSKQGRLCRCRWHPRVTCVQHREKTERTRVRLFAVRHRVDQPSHLAQLRLIRQLEEDFVKLPIPAKRTAWLMRAAAGELVVLSIRDQWQSSRGRLVRTL